MSLLSAILVGLVTKHICQVTKLNTSHDSKPDLKNNKMVNRGKAWRELFIFNIFGVYVSLVHSYFNAEEIYGVTYGFEISSEPVLLKEVSFLTFPLRQ